MKPEGIQGSKWGIGLVLLGAGALAAYAAKRWLDDPRNRATAQSGYDALCERVDRSLGWDKLPPYLGLLDLVGLRQTLRAKNLHDTGALRAAPPPPPWDEHYRTQRTPDGTYNDLEQPRMGSAGTRFGRNVPIGETFPGDEAHVLSPSPRVVSKELLARETFQPASTLNLLAAAWIQFMVRDWLSHGKNIKENPWQVPLAEGDDWHENPMRILHIAPDPTRTEAEAGTPPTYINTETHWWDASQIYGSSLAYQQRVRSGVDGKLRETPDLIIAPDDDALVEQSNLAGWWLGLLLMFSLFVQEHNAICDRLKREYPAWSDEELFQHARLINAALLAKIHTVEWTPAILGHPTLQIAMRTNWWGLAGEQVHKLLGRLSDSEVISGIPGSEKNDFGVPYAIAEEFVAVYRMHPLIPDDYVFRSVADGRELRTATFPDLTGTKAAGLAREVGLANLFYSFGVSHPGAIVLHNYPKGLQRFERPDGLVIDLAAHDILRSRELGVPRYCRFRRLLHLNAPKTFEELTADPRWAEELRRVYGGDIEQVDLSVGMFAERFPEGFGFSDTAFRIFILMASRRLNSDRFFTTDFRPEVYTRTGMKWIDDNTMETVLRRHYPTLAPAFKGVKNAFAPWNRIG